MKKALVFLVLVALIIGGCGASKDYVAQQIADSEGRTGAQIAGLTDKTDGNAAEIAKLRSLANELSKKTDMAINEAKGFENYQIIWSGEVNFDFDSYAITETAETILNEAGEKMEAYPGAVIEIAGHTDRTGSSGYNLMLGEKRSNAAKRFLSDRFGISLYRMFIISYGKDKPIATPDEMHAASKNRRVTLKVWGRL
ncbi:MAG: OmpA family protein [candidate division Zixibacteria bacterium]|nr:OmpA family protein [candidate division Zixibacteria bacterium]